MTLEVRELSCKRERPLFEGLSFSLSNGQLLLIKGENGAGKSSLLHLLAGLSSPLSGEITWQQTSITQNRDLYLANLHYIGHTNGLKLGLTVIEQLHLIQAYHSEIPRRCEERSDEAIQSGLSGLPRRFAPRNDDCICTADFSPLLSLLKLTDHQHSLTRSLSAGQKRRLALAKLFLYPRPLWILDEPLTALDADTQSLFLSHLESHLAHAGMVVMSTHHDLPIQHSTLRLHSC